MSNSLCRPARPNNFDLAQSPLEGINLIDASAGTGKTYTICGLVLRLLLEKALTIEQILVVTYTEAATEDLRDRIRQKLRQALQGINSPPGDDEFLQEYLAKPKDKREAARRLSEALRSFDEAAIFTIHGFCQRMLLENSFESNTLFDTELITDDSYLIKEIIEDFWRQNVFKGSDLFSQYAMGKLTPDSLHAFLRPFIPYPFLKFIPSIEMASGCSNLSDTETEYMEAYSSVCREWAAARDDVRHDLLHSAALKRNTYKITTAHDVISAMDDMAAAAHPSLNLFEKFILLTTSRINAGTKKNEIPHILPFYELCEALALARDNLQAQYDRCLLALKKRLLDSFRSELACRKDRENVFSFDDLLQRLHKALAGPGGASFARTIAQKYPAALIDEFQDTDPLQYEIFKAIFNERSLLFLIGDPKQAIYSFRGADIFTYMDAAAGSPLAHHTLGVNHRSNPALVKAVNTIFCRAQKPFIFDAISFQPVVAAQKHDQEHLTFDGQQKEPFILCFLDRQTAEGGNIHSSHQQSSPISKAAARRRIVSMVAGEVGRLLKLASENRVLINDKKLSPGDIAILVRKNDEARSMQQALNELRIPSVLHSGDDLFASEEAQEISYLLSAIESPDNIRKLKAGLLTRYFGLQANSISPLQAKETGENEKIIEQWLTKCRKYHALWNRFGFIHMFWTFMRENRVRQRMLASEDGERSLTNILHLAEILHQEAASRRLNMAPLLKYLRDRLSGDQGKNTEHQLRLESDEDRVKIVTIHKAKGLEYPIVFCPFTWEGTRLHAKKGSLFHQQKDGSKTELIFDAGSPELENHLQKARQEEMAENLRLLYVALTRAVHRCYLAWGPINGAETSAPAYLLHQDLAGVSELVCEDQNLILHMAADRFLRLSDHEILADLQSLAAAAEGTIRLVTGKELEGAYLLESKVNGIELRQRHFSGFIASDWKISSFSSLIANRSTPIESGQTLQDIGFDRDDFPTVQPISAELKEHEDIADIFTFPHGARPGTFLHELLEKADFSIEPPVAERLICEKLQHFGYDTIWYPTIARMLENLGNVRLHNNIPDLKLSNIALANCMHELEFYFPLSRVTPDDLKLIFCTQDLCGSAFKTAIPMEQHLHRLTFAPSRGYMRGFIDLVFEFGGKFYLLDWKSNYLGATHENYRQDKLHESILSGFYFLQYHIYCLALHLYLEKRLPEYRYDSHFGGVFYVFLRGVDQDLGPGYGIYYDLPDRTTIEMIQAKFIAGEQPE